MIDIYYLKEYGQIWAEYEKADFELFEYKKGSNSVVYPILKRKIDNKWWDVTSPYGYSGPFANSRDKKFYPEFRQAFNLYCKKNHVVSEFIRFHPLLENHSIAQGIIPTRKRGQTVWIDLLQSEDRLFKNLRKGHKNSIKKAENNHISIKLESPDNVKQFYRLYIDTMKRKKSINYYLFSEKFFKDHFNKLNNNIFWLGAHYQNKLIAGAVFLKSADFLHYYFAGSDSQYLSLSPGTSILWEAIKIGKKLGLLKFHLGGGIDDKLFFYKTGFSDNLADFYTGEVIHNRKIYNLLTRKNGMPKGNYFPLYRQLSSKT